MIKATHDTEAGYSVEQVHRLQPGMVKPAYLPQFKYPPCYSKGLGVYMPPRRPVPWLVAVLIVGGLCVCARMVL